MSTAKSQVTLCTNIVRYERLLELSKAQANAAVSFQQHTLSKLAENYDGYISERVGGRLMVTFSSPDAAMAAALSLLKAIEDEPFYVRIGMHFGDTSGVGQHVSGIGVVIATELEELASPDHIVISDALRQHLSSLPHVKIYPMGERFLPGVPEPVVAHRVERV